MHMPPTVIDATLRPFSRESETSLEADFQTDRVVVPVRLCNLPPFQAIAGQVLALTADPEISLKQISSVIEGDPAFAADVLFSSELVSFRVPLPHARPAARDRGAGTGPH